MQRKNVKNLVTAGLCLALGVAMPTLFHMVGLGSAFLPMHIPVLLCGLLCGWRLGLLCGIMTPLLCSLLTGMPPLFPTGVSMMFELAGYGAFTGFLYRAKQCNLYLALVGAMLGGRAVYGVVNAVLMGVSGQAYGMAAFLAGAFANAVPGIIAQLIFVPLIVVALQKSHLVEAPRGR